MRRTKNISSKGSMKEREKVRQWRLRTRGPLRTLLRCGEQQGAGWEQGPGRGGGGWHNKQPARGKPRVAKLTALSTGVVSL